MNPTRSWRKKIGPGEATDISTATKKVATANSGMAAQQNTMSIARFHRGRVRVCPPEDRVGTEVTRSGDIVWVPPTKRGLNRKVLELVSGDQPYFGAVDAELCTALQKGKQQRHAIAFVAISENDAGESLHRSGDYLDGISHSQRGLKGEEIGFVRSPVFQARDKAVCDDRWSVAGGHDVCDIRSVADGAVIDRCVETAKEIPGEQGTSHALPLAADDSVLPQPGKVSFKAEMLGAIGGDLRLLQGLGVKTIPVHGQIVDDRLIGK